MLRQRSSKVRQRQWQSNRQAIARQRSLPRPLHQRLPWKLLRWWRRCRKPAAVAASPPAEALALAEAPQALAVEEAATAELATEEAMVAEPAAEDTAAEPAAEEAAAATPEEVPAATAAPEEQAAAGVVA